MQLLSVIYEEVGKTALADCARRCDAPQIKSKGFPQPGLMPLLDRLVSSKLVIQANNQWLCHRLIVEDITRRAVREGRFESMAKAVQEVNRIHWLERFVFPQLPAGAGRVAHRLLPGRREAHATHSGDLR